MRLLLILLLGMSSNLFSKEKTKIIELTSQNSISFNQAFSAGYVAKKQVELIELVSGSKETDFYIVLSSPGGSISAGQLFIETAQGLGKNIHTITLFSASMSYQTVQALGKRYITPSGRLMSHRGYTSGMSGQIPGELNTRVKMLESLIEKMERVSSSRVGISLTQYKKDIRDELWLIGSDAVAQGHADEVALVKCSASLSGSYLEVFYTLFGPVTVEFSNCPIIAGPLSIKVGSKESMDVVNRFYSNMSNFIKMEF